MVLEFQCFCFITDDAEGQAGQHCLVLTSHQQSLISALVEGEADGPSQSWGVFLVIALAYIKYLLGLWP